MTSAWQRFLTEANRAVDPLFPDNMESVNDAAENVGRAIKAATGLADRIAPDPYTTKAYTYPVPGAAMRPGAPRYEQGLPAGRNMIAQAYDIATAPLTQPVRLASKALLALDRAISEPGSFAYQATYTGNPLYRDGVQPDDFVQMWKTSQKFSPGQAETWREMSNPDLPIWASSPLLANVLGTINPEPQPVNIYNPQERRRLQENELFSIKSGIDDIKYQLAAGIGVDAAAMSGAKAIGLNKRIDSLRDLDGLARAFDDHVTARETGTAGYLPRYYGKLLDDIANSSSSADLRMNPLIKYSPARERISSILEPVSDLRTIAKVVLADKGDRNAVAALLREDPDYAAEMFDLKFRLQMQALVDGAPPTITRDNAEAYARIYDRPLERPGNEFYRNMRDVLLSTETSPGDEVTGLFTGMRVNTPSIPSDGPVARAANALSRSANDVRLGRGVAQNLGDGWAATVLGDIGGSKPVTVIVQWLGGRRPQGFIPVNRLDPSSAVDEMMAQFGQVKWMRGKRTFTFERNGELVEMNGPQWSTEAISRLNFAATQGDTAIMNEVKSLEAELISVSVQRLGMTADEARDLAVQVVNGKNSSLLDASEIGFFFDDAANLVRITPGVQRQLVDNYVMFPIEDFVREARNLYGDLNKAQRGVLKARHTFDMVYELIQKYMRIQQLIKPAYLKNSVGEPAGAMLASMGLEELPALSANATIGFKNFYVNRARDLGLTVLRVGDKLGVSSKGKADRKIVKLNRELKLHQERLALETQLDNLESIQQLTKTDQFSPAYRAHLEKVADSEGKAVRTQLLSVYRQLGLSDSNWTQRFPDLRFSDLRAEVNDLANILDNPGAVDNLRNRLTLEQSRTQAVHAENVRRSQQELAATDLQLSMLRKRLALPSNEELAAQSAQQAERRGKLLDLRRLEARLAWAERAAAGSLDPNATTRARVQATLDDRIIERERLLAEMPEAGDQIALDATARRKTKVIDSLDRQIARLEDEMDKLGRVEPLPVPYRAQEVLDTYPAQIQALRDELGDVTDDVADAGKRLLDEEQEILRITNSARQSISELRKQAAAEIDGIKRDMPKVRKTDDPEALQDWQAIVSDGEIERLRLLAKKNVEDEADANWVNEYGDERNPDWIVPYLSAADEKVWRTHGIIPLETLRKMFTAKDWETGGHGVYPEEIWSWFNYGDESTYGKIMSGTDAPSAETWGKNIGGFAEMEMKAFAWKAPKQSSKGRKGVYVTSPISSSEMRGLLNGEIGGDDAFILIRQRQFDADQAAALRKLGYDVKATTTRAPRLFVRPDWSKWVASRPKQERADSLYENYLAEAQEYADRKYAEGLEQIAEAEARRDELIAAEQGTLANGELMLREIRAEADYPANAGKRKLPPLGDPIPSPFDRKMAEAEVRRLEGLRAQQAANASRAYEPSDRLLDLERQLDRAEKLQAAPAEVQETVRRLQDIADDTARSRLGFSTTLTPQQKQRELEQAISRLETQIGVLKEQSAAAVARRARLSVRTKQYEGDVTITTDAGTELTGPQLFSPNQFGSAMRNLFSAQYTSRATFDPGELGVANARVLGMAQGSMTIAPTDPRWLDELVYVSNRHVTGDDFAKLILSGASNARIMEWGSTPGGQNYLKQMGWKLSELNPSISSAIKDQVDPTRSVPVWDNGQINNLRNILFAYYPTQEARKAVLAGEVTADVLQEALKGVPIEQLSPIQGRAVQVAIGAQMQFVDLARKGVNAAWDLLATNPEDMFRSTFAGRMYEREIRARLNVLEMQGAKLSIADWNAQKQAAIADTLAESRKTFYNIVRYSNPVYASRYLFTYPQAVFNTLYRAARFTARRPGTAMVMNNAWTGFFTANAVDANGNPTDDYSKAEYITFEVPWSMRNATRSWGIDDQLQWPVKTLELVSDRMGASWTVQIPMQTLLVHRPDVNDELKAIFGEQYKLIFPFDTPSGLTDFMVGPIPAGSIIPGYAKSLYRSLNVSDEQYLRISTQILEHDLARYNAYSAGSFSQFTDPGPMPTPKSAAEKAAKYLRAASLGQFTIPGGSGIRPSGQVEIDAIRQILTKYDYDREAALPEVLQAFPDIDPRPYLVSTSDYSAYIPSTVEAYEVVTDPRLEPLLGQIVSDANADPQYVELLVADKTGTFDANVYDALGNLELPGTNEPVRSKIDEYSIEGKIEAGKSWEAYDKARANFDAEMIRLGRRSYTDAMQEQWNEWFNQFIDKPENKTFYAQYSRRDAAKSKLALDTLTLGLNDPAMAPYRDSIYWQTVDKYLTALPNWIMAYRAAESTERREKVKADWAGAVAYLYSAISPEFGRVYNKFLADYDLEVKGNDILSGR